MIRDQRVTATEKANKTASFVWPVFLPFSIRMTETKMKVQRAYENSVWKSSLKPFKALVAYVFSGAKIGMYSFGTSPRT